MCCTPSCKKKSHLKSSDFRFNNRHSQLGICLPDVSSNIVLAAYNLN